MVEIFLSHSTQDRRWCEWLKTSAEQMGIVAYLAEHDVRPGANLATKVERAIDRCDAVVVLLSDNGANAPFVHQEIGYALRAEKLVIPLVGPEIPPEKLAMLQGTEYIPFDFADPTKGHSLLRTALQRLIQTQAAKTQRDVALLTLACVALVLLALDS